MSLQSGPTRKSEEPTHTALIVEDDANFRSSLELLVQREGFCTQAAASLADARGLLAEHAPDVVLMDLSLPDGNGLEWLQTDESHCGAEIIVVTGSASVDTAVDALRSGALDYLTKPIDRTRLATALMKVARTRSLKREVGQLRNELRELGRFGRLVGRSRPMLEVYDLILRVAGTEASVLISGESGTGKELVAETIHARSARRNALLLPINCGAISPSLIESELFGHERGSFTGAERSPTKPIMPLTETMAPIINDEATKICRWRDLVSTPNCIAVTSPRVMRLSETPFAHSQRKPQMM